MFGDPKDLFAPQRDFVKSIKGDWCQVAVYVGPSSKLEGRRALIRDDPDHASMVLAQFDDAPLYIGNKNLAAGWHQFFRLHFCVDDYPVLKPLVRDNPYIPDQYMERLDALGFSVTDSEVYTQCCMCECKIVMTDYISIEECLQSDPKNQYCGGSPRCCP